jgi:hypothetical protein
MRFDQFMDYKRKTNFADFVDALIEDLALNPDEWENPDLACFLSAMAAWTRRRIVMRMPVVTMRLLVRVGARLQKS